MLLLFVETSTLCFGFELRFILRLLILFDDLLLRTKLLCLFILLLLLQAFSLPFFIHLLLFVLALFQHSPFFSFLLVALYLADDLVNRPCLGVGREPLDFTIRCFVNQIIIFSNVFFQSTILQVRLLNE